MTAVVVGGGMAGLVAALRLAQRGERVVLLEASDRLGGRVAPVEVDGVALDGGAESFAVRGGAVRRLADELGLGIAEPRASAWVALADRTVPLPAGGLLGIPSSPLATDVARVVGTAGSLRAYADRLLPVLKVGRYPMLGPLVRGRMGAKVLDRLVAPVVEGVYGVHPDDAPVDAIAPGLNAAITNTGALSSAVLTLRAAASPGAAALGIEGGVHRLVAALAAALVQAGVEVRTGAEVLGVHPAPHGGGFQVVTAREDVVAHRVVLAADGGAALDLLSDAAAGIAGLPRPAPAVSTAVLLVADAARLDAAPRGSGVLRAPEQRAIGATALTHSSAKWAWLADRLPPHRHVLRLAYRGAEAPRDEQVRADAAALLGEAVDGIRARHDVVWSDPAPPLAPETIAIRRALAGVALPVGLTIAGAWTAGTGLASVVASAERAAV